MSNDERISRVFSALGFVIRHFGRAAFQQSQMAYRFGLGKVLMRREANAPSK